MDLLAKNKNKLIDVVNDLKRKKSEGGVSFFDKMDEYIRNPKNMDLILQLVDIIYKEQGQKFNLILTGNFGDWVYHLIRTNKIKINGTVIHITGSLRMDLKERTFQVIQGKEDDIYNKNFVLLDDSFYSGSTKEEIEKNLKKYGAKIIKTYVIYDGSFQRRPDVVSLYRYYDYHSKDILPIQKLISILNNFKGNLPYDILEDKIVRGQIRSVQELLDTIRTYRSKFKSQLNLKSYSYKREYEKKKILNYRQFLNERANSI
jgi:hypoxanthine-guanine phosphoribosyltransferase